MKPPLLELYFIITDFANVEGGYIFWAMPQEAYLYVVREVSKKVWHCNTVRV